MKGAGNIEFLFQFFFFVILIVKLARVRAAAGAPFGIAFYMHVVYELVLGSGRAGRVCRYATTDMGNFLAAVRAFLFKSCLMRKILIFLSSSVVVVLVPRWWRKLCQHLTKELKSCGKGRCKHHKIDWWCRGVNGSSEAGLTKEHHAVHCIWIYMWNYIPALATSKERDRITVSCRSSLDIFTCHELLIKQSF